MNKDHSHVFTSHIASFWRVRHKKLEINGETWSYIAQGDPRAEPIVFIHGMGTNNSIWRSQMQSYDNRKYYRIALNIPGACLTQYFKTKKHSLHELCRWLDQALDQLELRPAHITAHSTLTLFATFYAATRPKKVKSLTLISIPDLWGSKGGEKPTDIIKRFRSDISFSSVEDAINLFNSLFCDPPQLPKAMHKSGYLRHTKHLDNFMEVIDDLEQGLPLVMPQTKNIRCPLLIINGENDLYSSPELTNSLHWHYPTANTVNLQQCAHLVMLEKPMLISQIHRQFLTQGYVSETNKYTDIIHSHQVYKLTQS